MLFCNVKTGKPGKLIYLNLFKIAKAVKELELEHVVITSVDRDDLSDGGAKHFVDVINCLRKECPNTTIEILTPDFLKKNEAKNILSIFT